ncbi:hypothetical protein QWY31_03910 [Cytophagales bacterium LB-30]|uniref:Phenylacetate--CoA ligase family protein n=1 Tax=Shiella aurantiaca TaxID=3058365 RepID=A0ABT8F2F3_9BACT|nr:hypothetical protein [Shiella aurantiaca]MDN4164632.1 hypothetical protein [Shiella aurantiaca]
MNSLLLIKKFAERIPYSFSKILVQIPFSWRLGSQYKKSRLEINQYKTEEAKLDYALFHFNNIFQYAKTFPFYNSLYSKNGVIDLKITSIDDILKIPIISKEDIRSHFDYFKGSMRVNTGGTTGSPMSLYLDKNAFAREWAHMHTIWETKGYNQKLVKLTLRGKNLGNKLFAYNPIHNEFVFNTYIDIKDRISEITDLIETKKIGYIHGYPSAIYDFFKVLEDVASDEQIAIVRKWVKVCLMGSEFPHKYIKDYLNTLWELEFVSWYGHTEMCILAHDENNDNKYVPFHTYGYAEVVDGCLIGTSFHNFDMPLIRYDTGDKASGVYFDNGLLKDFSITEGRSGDFVLDRVGKKIPLTALIFGRHHRVFDYIQHIQVKQVEQGKAEIYISSNSKIDLDKAKLDMDLTNVDMDFEFKYIKEPIKSLSGKLKLKI